MASPSPLPCLLAWLPLALLPACVPDYRPPQLAEPHAVVRVRFAYTVRPGPELEQVVMVNGEMVRDASTASEAGETTGSRPIPVRPGTAGLTVQATFFHNHVTTHAETYDTTAPGPCGDTTCTQTVPHTRAKNQVDRIEDASCTAGRKLQAKAGENYLLEYHFEADRRCSLRCFRQSDSGKVPCDDPTAP